MMKEKREYLTNVVGKWSEKVVVFTYIRRGLTSTLNTILSIIILRSHF